MSKEKLFFIDEHGCAKNQVDAELISTNLLLEGWKRTDFAEDASLIIINSCGFINSAKEESLNSLFQARSMYPDAKIVLAGCLAERYAKDFEKELSEADCIFGNGDISKIGEVVNSLFSKSCSKKTNIFPQEGISNGERLEFLNLPGSAFIKITEGCDNICSFCAIPLIRGHLRSRPIEEIVEEISYLNKAGMFEFNLIGQDLATYGLGSTDLGFGNASFVRGSSGSMNLNGEKSPLYNLLSAISAIEGDFWIRLLYIHPDNFPLDILEIIKNDKRFLPYFDIPFQSGDDSIIKAMNRHGSQNDYVELVKKIRSECEKSFYKDCAIRTTFLCGFPGETDENAENTKKFLKTIKTDWSGCFAYSKEEDTPAYSMKGQVGLKKAQKRCDQLQKVQNEIIAELLLRHVGKTYRVLIEEIVDGEAEGIAIARSWFQAPDVDGNVVLYYDLNDEKQVSCIECGKTVSATILGVSGIDLYARLCE